MTDDKESKGEKIIAFKEEFDPRPLEQRLAYPLRPSFTREDVAVLRDSVAFLEMLVATNQMTREDETRDALASIADRIEALLPPE